MNASTCDEACHFWSTVRVIKHVPRHIAIFPSFIWPYSERKTIQEDSLFKWLEHCLSSVIVRALDKHDSSREAIYSTMNHHSPPTNDDNHDDIIIIRFLKILYIVNLFFVLFYYLCPLFVFEIHFCFLLRSSSLEKKNHQRPSVILVICHRYLIFIFTEPCS